mmetsp:Transcript_28794/g.52461  ORF Transcript_28794/g.52461 Transcript_28794/m.52461 type:complete len:172 (+) Transcript_28794:1-516(+)
MPVLSQETNVALLGGSYRHGAGLIVGNSSAPAPPKPTYPPAQLPSGYPCRFSVCVPGITHPGARPAVILPTYPAPNAPDGLSSEAVVPLGQMPESAPPVTPSVVTTTVTTTLQTITAAPPSVETFAEAGDVSRSLESPGLSADVDAAGNGTASGSSANSTENISWMVPSIP